PRRAFATRRSSDLLSPDADVGIGRDGFRPVRRPGGGDRGGLRPGSAGLVGAAGGAGRAGYRTASGNLTGFTAPAAKLAAMTQLSPEQTAAFERALSRLSPADRARVEEIKDAAARAAAEVAPHWDFELAARTVDGLLGEGANDDQR